MERSREQRQQGALRGSLRQLAWHRAASGRPSRRGVRWALCSAVAFALAGSIACTAAETGEPLPGAAPVAAGDAPPAPLTCDEPVVPVTPVRRLTREEYRRTLADLLGEDASAAGGLPPEERGNGFGNDAAFQSVSVLLAESYARIAEELAERATSDAARRAALLGCEVSALGESACIDRFIAQFGARAYRRPLAQDERERLAEVFAEVRAFDGFESALRAVIEVMVQSPAFLYRLELSAPDPATGLARLNGHELATRLSYLLWGTMPDAELMRAADAGELDTAAQLRAQAERLLEEPRARGLVQRFHTVLFGLEGLGNLQRSPVEFPGLPDGIGGLLLEETQRFVEHVVFEGAGDLGSLLSSNETFLNQQLAELYGVPGVTGPELRLVSMDPERRAGLLTHGSVINAHTPGIDSHPVLRGLLVRRVLLCDPPPDPPDGINLSVPAQPGASTRQRFEQHRADPLCAGCHRYMDPIGFGFEHYDAAGRWRELDDGVPVDASGEVVGTDVAGPFSGARELAERLAVSQDVADCYVSHWFAHGYGRRATPEDLCSREQLRQAFREGQGSVRELVLALTESDAFRYRREER